MEKLKDEDFAAWVNKKLKEGYAPTTMWARVSAIKSVHAALGHKIPGLVGTSALLKAKQKGHDKKKSSVFTDQEMSQFLHLAR